MGLSPMQSRLVVLVFLMVVWGVFYSSLNGYGYYSWWFVHFQKNSLAALVATVICGILGRAFHVSIPPNYQGIQVCLGKQTHEVWPEGNLHFVLRPIWDIWKQGSIQHFTFTIAVQNRTQEGHQMMVFATASAVPTTAFLLEKISREDLVVQLMGYAQQTVAYYIQHSTRQHLFEMPAFDLTSWFEGDKEELDFNTYGVQVKLRSTKSIEVDPHTMQQFDLLARSEDMRTIVGTLGAVFPGTTDVERYAMYAGMTGFKPSVMTHIVHGQGNTNFFLGGAQTN